MTTQEILLPLKTYQEALTNTIDGTNLTTQLDATGYYDTQLQTFKEFYSHGTASLSVHGQAYNATWFLHSPGGHVVGPVVTVNNFGCQHMSINILLRNHPEDMTGKIALIRRGTCSAALKVALARRLGAAGVIIYNNATDSFTAMVSPKAMAKGPTIPSCGIYGPDGQKLLAEIKTGKTVIGTLNVNAVNEDRFTRNVVTTTKNPGMNDNASGLIAMLEVALHLARFKVKNAVRLAFDQQENLDLPGLDITCLPSPLTSDVIISAYFVYKGNGSGFNTSGCSDTPYSRSGPLGSDLIERVFQDYYNATEVTTAPVNLFENTIYALCDYFGIPIGSVVSRQWRHKVEEESNWFASSITFD
ncbi:hypothetical protein AMATHDRAFT_50253 [Amanita thiersii Skay4041]|uniref:Peptide hydrolase n=1 Tax=Amanita thiersii Skay4041 TaxID=703135 RepID=A0A2A9NII9_9AGAR|nr:hypothetical protein AMATHDRAFT_50253 [Amanita thiersii Skay4041]